MAHDNGNMPATTTHQSSEYPTFGTSRPWLRSLLTIFGLIVAGGLIWTGLSGLLSSPSADSSLTAAAVPASHVEEPALITAAIKDLRNGMRVLANNPELAGQQVELLDIEHPEEWRNYVPHLPKEDGATVEITLLEPADWLEYMSDDGGKTVYLDLHEMGAVGLAKVVAIEPCPPIEPDDGTGRPLITGTFKHTSATVIDLQISGESQVIGTTANHPFWSVDRNRYVAAGKLRLSERLRTVDDEITHVIGVSPRPGKHDVYNIQVDGEHVFYVGSSGVLVHNSCTPGKSATELARRLGREGEAAADIVKNTKHIDSLSRRKTYRIPDELKKRTLTEVKNVKYQHFSTQIQDSLHYSIMTNRQMILKVRRDTVLSKDLKKVIKAGWIKLEFIK